MTSKLEECNKKLKKSHEMYEISQVGREETDQRTEILGRMQQLKNEEKTLLMEIQKYKNSDPEVLENLQAQSAAAKEAANRWTDNIFAIKSWCKNKFFIEEETLDKQFGLSAEMDYLS